MEQKEQPERILHTHQFFDRKGRLREVRFVSSESEENPRGYKIIDRKGREVPAEKIPTEEIERAEKLMAENVSWSRKLS